MVTEILSEINFRIATAELKLVVRPKRALVERSPFASEYMIGERKVASLACICEAMQDIRFSWFRDRATHCSVQ